MTDQPTAREMVEMADRLQTQLENEDRGRDGSIDLGDLQAAIDALRLAAQAPPGEPVAWRWKPYGTSNWILAFDQPKHPSAEPLYATTPAALPQDGRDPGGKVK